MKLLIFILCIPSFAYSQNEKEVFEIESGIVISVKVTAENVEITKVNIYRGNPFRAVATKAYKETYNIKDNKITKIKTISSESVLIENIPQRTRYIIDFGKGD